MSEDRSLLGELESHVRALQSATAAVDVFRCLLSATRIAAPRSCVFLFRGESWRGWGSLGYSRDVAARQRASVFPANSPPFDELARKAEEAGVLSLSSPPAFGQPEPGEAMAAPVRAGQRLVACVLAEREAGETPWEPHALAILAHVASSRLEVELLRRRLEPAARPAHPKESSRTETTEARPETAAEAVESSLAPAPNRAEASPDARRQQEARRFARLVATDIRLYNEDAVILGRRHRDLARRLSEHLRRGRETYSRRFPELGPEGLELLKEAYIEVLAAGDRSLVPEDPKDW